MSRICVPIIGPTLADARRQLREAERCADLVELCVQRFDPFDVAALGSECSLPVIFKLTSVDNIPALLAAAPNFVDIDESIFEQVFPKCRPGTRVICSTHDFDGMPDLEATLARLRRRPADLYKVATTAECASDALDMLDLMRSHSDVIGVAMGEAGQPTRVLSPLVSDLWTYAPLTEEEATAPGQLTVDTLLEIYRFREIGKSTEILGVMGDPVRYSPGPRFHNARFRERGLNAAYLPFLVRKEEAKEFLGRIATFNVRGLSVTMPLKQEVIPGDVVNTLSFEGGKWLGDNTDGPGAIDCVMPVLGKKIAVLGRGGAGQAIAAEATRRGAEVRIFNRTWDALKLFEYDTLIHCTPVGMEPEGDESPIEAELIRPGTTVLDIVSGTRETRLLREALRRGCRIATGWNMYVNQAERQLKRWFGEQIDTHCTGESPGRLSESAAL